MIGTQLDLWPKELSRIPWAGLSTRVLTKAAKLLYLRREPVENDRFFRDPSQLLIWTPGENTRPPYGGADLLVPLKESE